ncbi:Aste57867_18309 [Aphanomyces stellatus]|uniref:Aste57867_18309 protein n=1 Tax=Aphanomyces stellatus TaxID=120398 RepID=A0A485LA37_9STRA|nr:hypothetical protein As57867_018247 [Aphanomyces stellatus]VFT95045.1 Aste57867_18309 [Aphanomyces stellatus]
MSWQKTPTLPLMDMLAYFVDLALAGTPPDDMPTADKLCTEFRTSPKTTYFGRKQLAFVSPIVAGPGWFAIGNSAGFTNPLISPGINAGLVSVLRAATLTLETLGRVSAESHFPPAARYQYVATYSAGPLPRLALLNKVWYNSFRDPRFFECVLTCYWVLGLGDGSIYQQSLTQADQSWLLGVGEPALVDFFSEVLPLIEGPCDGKPADNDVVTRVQALCRSKLDTAAHLCPVPWSSILRCYDDSLVRVPGKTNRTERISDINLVQCTGCTKWRIMRLARCYYCGTQGQGSNRLCANLPSRTRVRTAFA